MSHLSFSIESMELSKPKLLHENGRRLGLQSFARWAIIKVCPRGALVTRKTDTSSLHALFASRLLKQHAEAYGIDVKTDLDVTEPLPHIGLESSRKVSPNRGTKDVQERRFAPRVLIGHERPKARPQSRPGKLERTISRRPFFHTIE